MPCWEMRKYNFFKMSKSAFSWAFFLYLCIAQRSHHLTYKRNCWHFLGLLLGNFADNNFSTTIKMEFPKHLVTLIAGLYEDQKATIRWNWEHSNFFKIRKGVRQGCILSPHLFNVYAEQVMREVDIDDMGVKE